MLQYNLWVIL